VTKLKLRGSWGGNMEAQGGLGVAKPKVRQASGSTWGRSRGTLGRFWGVSGGPPRNFRADFFVFPGRKRNEHLS